MWKNRDMSVDANRLATFFAPANGDMKYEINRVLTFYKWPSSLGVEAIELAMMGFCALGKGFQLKCAFCNVKIYRWKDNDKLFAKHRRVSSSCPFLIQNAVSGNVAMEYRVLASKLGLRPDPIKGADDRAKSYTYWTRWNSSKPEDMVDAGFYYESDKDRLRCFSCAAVVNGMYECDDIWLMHNKQCQFIQTHAPREKVPPLACVCCMVKEVSTIVAPCNHVILCDTCSPNFSKCPKCRCLIKSKEKIYF